MKQPFLRLTVYDFAAYIQERNLLIVDCRDASQFIKGHIPGSVSVEKPLCAYLQNMPGFQRKPLALVTGNEEELQAADAFLKAGYDVLAVLVGGYSAWGESEMKFEKLDYVTAEELADNLEEHPVAMVLDLREDISFAQGHVIGAIHLPLNNLQAEFTHLDHETPYYVYCAGNDRGAFVVSWFHCIGYNNFYLVMGGYKAIEHNERFFLSHPAVEKISN